MTTPTGMTTPTEESKRTPAQPDVCPLCGGAINAAALLALRLKGKPRRITDEERAKRRMRMAYARTFRNGAKREDKPEDKPAAS